MSNRTTLAIAVAALAVTLLPAGALRAEHGGHNVSIDSDEGGSGCGRTRMHWDDRETARGEETIHVARGRATLNMTAATNGGIRVEGWDGSDYEITACKFASADTAAEAQALLSRLGIENRGDEVTAKGPSDDGWAVFFVVKAPKNADVSLSVANGPLSIRSASGTFKVRSKNGPIALKGVAGKVDADVVNGPISMVDGSGEVTLNAVNGPITVKLAGDSWDGAGITGRAENGPVTLQVAETFRSGIRIETEGHGPLSCRLEGCPKIERRHGMSEPRTIELGSGRPIINLSASNGPVSVGPRRG